MRLNVKGSCSLLASFRRSFVTWNQASEVSFKIHFGNFNQHGGLMRIASIGDHQNAPVVQHLQSANWGRASLWRDRRDSQGRRPFRVRGFPLCGSRSPRPSGSFSQEKSPTKSGFSLA